MKCNYIRRFMFRSYYNTTDRWLRSNRQAISQINFVMIFLMYRHPIANTYIPSYRAANIMLFSWGQ